MAVVDTAALEGDMRIDVYLHTADATPDPRLDLIVTHLRTLIEGFNAMSTTVGNLDAQIAQLQADVAKEGDVINAATTLITGFSAQLQAAIDAAQAAGVKPEQLAALSDLDAKITAASDALSAAVAANTPAAPVDTPPAAA